MWGAALHDRSEGVHRPLLATVMSFRSLAKDPAAENEHQVVVALDHCLLGRAEMEALLDAAELRSGVSRAQMVVTFSHTHAAGLMSLDRADLPGGDLIPAYLQRLNETVGTLLRQAIDDERPVTVTYGSGRCNLAAHRDFWDVQSEQWVCGFHPPDHQADDAVWVARVTDEGGHLVAALVNYACHPTTLAWDNRLISPDFPGAMRETVEQALSVPCVFLQGASGDLGPRYGFVGDCQVADRHGRELGYAALSALTALPPPQTSYEYQGPVISGATLGVWNYVPLDGERRTACARWGAQHGPLPLPYRPGLSTLAQAEADRQQFAEQEAAAAAAGDEARRRDFRAMVERRTRMIARLKQLPPGERFPFQLLVWRMGDAVWVATQGEVYNLLQTALRSKFPSLAIIVCSLANGWGPSYLPPAELYGTGIYQESIALLAPGSLEQVIAEAERRIVELTTTSERRGD
jgi:hypothetical protein